MTRRARAHVVVADIEGRQAEGTALRVAAETGRRTPAAPIRLWGVAPLDALGVFAEEAPVRLLDIWRPAAPLPEHSRALLGHIGPPVIGYTLGEREAVRYSASNEAACPDGGFHASGQSHGAEGDAAG